MQTKDFVGLGTLMISEHPKMSGHESKGLGFTGGFIQRVLNLWNRLPQDVEAGSSPRFKGGLDKFLEERSISTY